MAAVVHVQNLWKRYVLLHTGPANIKDAVLRRVLRRHVPREEFWAVRDVSFELAPGDAMGFIGPNGSGKSTILAVLARVLRPTRGEVAVRGRICGLLEAAAGFHMDLTGIENIQMVGSLLGMSRRAVNARLPRIVQFASAEAYIDTPVRTYSTGMYTRVAFAAFVHMDPEVLVLDEILAVGDEAFHEQAYARLAALRAGGCAVVFVSHVMEQVRRICDRVIWLDHGQIVAEGPPAAIIPRYTASLTGGDPEAGGA